MNSSEPPNRPQTDVPRVDGESFLILLERPILGVFVHVSPMEALATVRWIAEVVYRKAFFLEALYHILVVWVSPAGGNVDHSRKDYQSDRMRYLTALHRKNRPAPKTRPPLPSFPGCFSSEPNMVIKRARAAQPPSAHQSLSKRMARTKPPATSSRPISNAHRLKRIFFFLSSSSVIARS